MMNATVGQRMRRPVLWTLAVIVAVVARSWRPIIVFGPRPTDFARRQTRRARGVSRGKIPPAFRRNSNRPSMVERGEYLTRAADCVVCHTAKDGAPFAGGRAFVLPFGTLYSTNITPDAETGIGSYTRCEFPRCRAQGHRPRQHQAVSGDALCQLHLHVGCRCAGDQGIPFYVEAGARAGAAKHADLSVQSARPHERLVGASSIPTGAIEPNVDRSAEWNRGAYLVEAMAHCGECHTPRNLAFALNNRQKFAGAVQAGWRAYNITADHASGVGAWSDADLAHYLSGGHADGRGTAAGPMGEAVDESLSHLNPSDVAAMVDVFAHACRASRPPTCPQPEQSPAPAPSAEMQQRADADGRAVYEGACAGCHGWTGVSPVIPFATLTGTRAVNDPTATNVAQVIIRGGQRHVAGDSNNMPAFGSAYSDAEIASVANYVTARFGAKGSNLTAAKVAKLRSEE